MIFTEFRFLWFFLVVFVVHWALPRQGLRKLWLLAASWGFYATWNWKFLALLLFITALDYGVGLALGEAKGPARRRWIAASVVANLGLLAVFKYYNFFVDSAVAALAAAGLHVAPRTLDVVIPLGISFHTFQSLSYTIDVYRGSMRPVRSFTDFALFVAFFPQLVAGPIVRAAEFLPRLAAPLPLRAVRWRQCALLFLVGYLKKACVADQVSPVVDAVFADPGAYDPASKWLAAALYALQIYCDFSGYSDMAIALAGTFGHQFPLNFDFPYVSASVTEFWRRWHMSLSSWFRDYLYVPLGGNRKGPLRTCLNLVVVFFLCGLWHGANWTFVIWGLWHGAALLVERAGFGRVLDRLPLVVRTPYALLVVVLGWVFFRARNLHVAVKYLGGMLGRGTGSAVQPPAWWLLVAGFAVVHVLMYRGVLLRPMRRLPWWGFALVYGALVALALPWVAIGYQPFIYFQF